MQPGFQFKFVVEGVSIRVVYGQHFVNRYYEKRTGVLSPSDKLNEDMVKRKIVEALPQIAAIIESDEDAEGIIQSRKYRLAMSFMSKPSSKGPMILMKSIMLKANYIAKSIKDYVIQVNPPASVRFRRGISLPLREAILDDLVPLIGSLEDETSYHLGGEFVEYWVERIGNAYYVDEADWKYDLYEVSVA